MKLICRLGFLLLFLIGRPVVAQQFFDVQVEVLSTSDSSALGGAYVKLGSYTASTNLQGVAQFSVKQNGQYHLTTSYMGYETNQQELQVHEDKKTTVFLKERSVLLTQAEVLAEPVSKAEDVLRNQVMKVSIVTKDIKSIPAILGEPDVLRNLAFVSGVQSSLPGGAGLYVRGGDVYHNALFLDGVPAFNINHAFGYVSPIPTGSTEKVTFYKQAFPVQYQGALSSVMDVDLSTASTKKWHGEFAGGFGSLRGSLGIPLKKDKLSLQLGARVSTFAVLKYLNEPLKLDLGELFGYEDYSAKLHYRLSNNEVLEVMGYYSADQVEQAETFRSNDDGYFSEAEYEVSSLLGSVRYSRQGQEWFQQHQLYLSGYDFDFIWEFPRADEPEFPDDLVKGSTYTTAINQLGYKNKWETELGKAKLKLGSDWSLFYRKLPRAETSQAEVTRVAGGGSESLFVPSLFASYQYRLTRDWEVQVGIRTSYFQSGEKTSLIWQPRLNTQYSFNDQWAAFAAYDRSTSFIHRFRNNYFSTALDVPVLASEQLPVAIMDQVASGLVFSYGQFNGNLSGFYRNYANVIDRDYAKASTIYGEGDVYAELTPPVHIARSLIPVNGWSYGLETDMRYSFDIYSFKASYTWSRALRQAEEINRGRPYPFEFNREHMLTARALVRFKRNSINKITEIGLAYAYGTGNFTQFGIQQQLPSPFSNAPTLTYILERNNAQLPAMQHLDVVFNFISKKEKGVRIFSISVFNVLATPIITNYQRIAGAYGRHSSGATIKGTGPWRILPSFSYSYQF